MGINGAAKAGDDFIVLDSEKEAKILSENRAEENKQGKNPLTFATQESAFADKSTEELNLIINLMFMDHLKQLKMQLVRLNTMKLNQK